MGICETYKVSHSHFLGGPRRWTNQDRDKAIWFRVRQAQTCQSCGTHPYDWDEAEGGRPDAWRAVSHHCKGCQVLQVAQERLDQKNSREDAAPIKKGSRLVLKRSEDKP